MKAPEQKPVTRDEAKRAADECGLQLDGLTREDVTREYRRAIRLAHPDTGASPDEASTLIAGARHRRTVLLRWLSEQPDRECLQCNGSGYVNVGMRVRRCTNPRCW